MRSIEGQAVTAERAATTAPPRVTTGQPKICILGGGFGGFCTAVQLNLLDWPPDHKPEVTLIDREPRFLFKPLLYELLARRAPLEEVAPEYESLLAPYKTRFLQRQVSGVQIFDGDNGAARGGVVTFDDFNQERFDYLVVALGGVANLDMADGARDHAVPFACLKDFTDVSAALDSMEQEAKGGRQLSVTVVGAGNAGVELSANIQHRLGKKAQVQIVASGDRVLPAGADSLADTCEKALKRMGVRKRRGRVTTVREGRNSRHRFVGKRFELYDKQTGETVEEDTDLVIWTAGQKAVTKLQEKGFLPFDLDKKGCIVTDSSLNVPGHEHIFAIGDTAAAVERTSGGGAAETGGPWPPTAQVALQQADYAAYNLWSRINNKPLVPFRYQHLGDLMSLGTGGAFNPALRFPEGVAKGIRGSPLARVARVCNVNLDNLESGLVIEGWPGGALRRLAYWYRQPTWLQKIRVGRGWADAVAKNGPQSPHMDLTGIPSENPAAQQEAM